MLQFKQQTQKTRMNSLWISAAIHENTHTHTDKGSKKNL